MEVIIGIILLLIIFAGGDATTKEKGDYRIARGVSGDYYVYDIKTGEVYFTGTKAECVRYLKEIIGR